MRAFKEKREPDFAKHYPPEAYREVYYEELINDHVRMKEKKEDGCCS